MVPYEYRCSLVQNDNDNDDDNNNNEYDDYI